MKYFNSILLTCGLFACTKTETIAPKPEPGNRIESFRIVNVQGDPLEAAISDKENTITVYLPFYKQLSILEPAISLPAGASISPASGTLVENVFEALRTERKTTYTVTGADGSKREYKLQLMVLQPDLVLKEVTTPDDIKVFSINMKEQYSSFSVNIQGSGFLENNDLMRVVPVDADGKELPPFMLGITNLGDITRITIHCEKYQEPFSPLVQALPATGLYRLRVYCYGRVKTLQFPIRINKMQ